MSSNFRISDGRPSGEPDATPGEVAFSAGFMVLASIMLTWAGWTRHPGLHVPPAIAYVVALVLIAGAMMFVLKLLGYGNRLDPLAAVVTGGFTVMNG